MAFESQLIPDTVLEKVAAFEDVHGGPTFDAMFLLDRGWLINFGDGQGAFRFGQPDGDSTAGWVVQEVEEVLFDFLVSL